MSINLYLHCLHFSVTLSVIMRPPSISGILRSVVKRNTDELPGDHSEDSNAGKKVQLIMSTATLTKVITPSIPWPHPIFWPRPHTPLTRYLKPVNSTFNLLCMIPPDCFDWKILMEQFNCFIYMSSIWCNCSYSLLHFFSSSDFYTSSSFFTNHHWPIDFIIITQAVRLLLNDVQGGFNIEYSGGYTLLNKP